MTASILVATFWLSLGALVWIVVGLPAVLLLRRRRPVAAPEPGAPLPAVSYLIVVHNERAVIDAKLANLESLDYPRDRLQVVIASDGSDDGTEVRVAAWAGPTPVELVALPRVGKNAALNEAIAASTGDVLVFSDADSMLERDALLRLIEPFGAEEVGAVGGDYRYATEEAGGASERRYWSLDRVWKRLESRSGSMTSATGQIYAIRRALVSPVPDGVTDDFYVSTGAVAAGRRLVFAPEARAHGPVAATPEAEYRRKVRLMSRGFASVWARRALLDPRRTGFYALQLATHKVARRLFGLPLLGLLVASLGLAPQHGWYRVAALAQMALYGAAALGWWLRGRAIGRLPWLAGPLYLVMVGFAGLRAAWDFAAGRRHVGWVPDRSGPELGEARPSSVEGGS